MRLPLSLAALLLLLPALPAAAAEKRPAVLDTAYGETLFAFYQHQYFDAISRLLVARDRGELQRQANDGELLLGGLYVQYGVPEVAGEIFTRLLPGTDTSPQALKIWLALAELNYRRERFPEVLAIIEQRFARDTAPEAAVVLAVKSLMRLGRYREAVAWLGARQSDLPESRYLRFNIAVALVADGDAEAGAQMLSPLLALPAADDEMLALRDRVALALAATRLQQQRAADAVAALAGARLVGPYSSEAMLVYGIAATRNAELGRATGALASLVQRSRHEQSVQEGWIALAQVYEARNDPRRALTTYRSALVHLNLELEYLQAQAVSIDNGEWFAALESRAGDIAMRDDRSGLADNDVLGMPLHYRQFAGNRFVLSFAQYVEVSRLARLAVDWRDRVPVLAYLVDSRESRHRRLGVEAAGLLASTPVEPLQMQQQALQARVDDSIVQGDPLTYATPARQRLAALAGEIEARMARWPERDWSRQRERLALLRGVLAWEAAREQSRQAWALQRVVRETGRQVADTGALRERVARAAARQQVSVAGWQQQLVVEDAELARLAGESARLRAGLRSQLEDDARATIRAQRERIVQLAAEAYYAIGQIEHGAWRQQREARMRSSTSSPAAGATSPQADQGAAGSRSAE